jgi:hypothetical protein
VSDNELAIACTLDPDALRGRVDDWAHLLGAARSREPIEAGRRLVFDADPVMAARIADLSVREQQCCAFFRFDLAIHGGHVTLDITAPAEAAELVDQLVGT